jgi:hypothetical protein
VGVFLNAARWPNPGINRLRWPQTTTRQSNRHLKPESDSQALAALGAARIDHGTAAAGFHANQKTVGTGATCLGGLVGAFHNCSFVPNAMNQRWAKPKIIANFRKPGKFTVINTIRVSPECASINVVYDRPPDPNRHVDKL